MATYGSIIEGLRILSRYSRDGQDCLDVAAAHDEFFAGHGASDALTEDDARAMERLGWRREDGGWAIFT